MKSIAGTISLLLFTLVCLAQNKPFSEERSIGAGIVDFTIDNLGNIYTIGSSNQLKKFGPAGDSLGIFNDIKQYGRISSVDVSNPLKILLFYKDFATIVVLDRFLNVRNTVNLRKLNINQATLVCQSYDNGIWIYDEQDARLKKISNEGNLASQSSDFRMIVETALSPSAMTDQNRLVYLYDPAKGLFTLDYFGVLKNKVALLDWRDVQVVEGTVFGRKQESIQQYHPGTLMLKEKLLPAGLSGMSRMKLSTSHLYCLLGGVIKVYRL